MIYNINERRDKCVTESALCDQYFKTIQPGITKPKKGNQVIHKKLITFVLMHHFDNGRQYQQVDQLIIVLNLVN